MIRYSHSFVQVDLCGLSNLPLAPLVSSFRSLLHVVLVIWDGHACVEYGDLGCRSARYKPATANNSCSPANVRTTGFPVNPGAAMPVVNGCRKQDYAVLIVVGLPATH